VTYVYKTTSKPRVVDGEEVRKAIETWRFEFRDWTGRRRKGKLPRAKNEADARRQAQHVAELHYQVRRGFIPLPREWQRNAGKPFVEVRAEYLAWGRAGGGRNGFPWSRVHDRMTTAILTWWEKHLRVKTVDDLYGRLKHAERTLRGLAAAGRSEKTITNYAAALKSLCAWAEERDYLSHDPLRKLKTKTAEPQTWRRALTAAEICRLLATAPEHRRLVYQVALTSGLRQGELRALTVHHLDVQNTGLRLDAAWTKNRKAAFQRLPASVVDALEGFIEAGTAAALYANRSRARGIPDQPLLYLPMRITNGFYHDLDTAGIPRWTPGPAGGRADFHSLRVTFVSLTVELGASAREAQIMARHSTPTITMNTYAKASVDRLAELAELVGKAILPTPTGTQNSELAKAAGAENDAAPTTCSEVRLMGGAGVEPAGGHVVEQAIPVVAGVDFKAATPAGSGVIPETDFFHRGAALTE